MPPVFTTALINIQAREDEITSTPKAKLMTVIFIKFIFAQVFSCVPYVIIGQYNSFGSTKC
jgi:hypothetical protein